MCRADKSCAGHATAYQDDPDAEILVLGDSFLRIYQQDEPGAAGFIAHLAQELQQPLTSLVNDGGASTLVRQELYRRPAPAAQQTGGRLGVRRTRHPLRHGGLADRKCPTVEPVLGIAASPSRRLLSR